MLTEKVLATRIAPEKARSTLTPLVGIYELRLGDAHLPSSKLAEAYELVGIPKDAPPLAQAFKLIAAAAIALQDILEIFEPGPPSQFETAEDAGRDVSSISGG